MFETELKFQVPPPQRAALERAVATATSRTTRLQAVYADTADRRLAAAGLALRLRKEGRVWVQTLKGRGDGLMQRLEHEVRLPPGPGVPTLDAVRHAGTAVGQQLLELLSDGAALQPIYRTDIQRLHRQLRHGAALIELAYDRGQILAGGRRQEVCEIEFEILRGPGSALIEVARRWALRHQLWWDVRSKSEIGHRLALDLQRVPATRATAATLPADASTRQALALWLAGSLEQALPNAAEIASGTAGPEHLHQLRTALRRLRSVLRVFAPWAADPAAALALEREWRAPFGLLGAARDQDVLGLSLRPMLDAALQDAALHEASALALPALPAVAGPAPADVVRGATFTALLLRTLALCVATPAPEELASAAAAAAATAPAPAPLPALSQAAPAAVRPLWRQVRRGAAAFAQADAEAQHRLRKRIKRLRDALVCTQALLKRKAASVLRRRLAQALKALGELNDLQVAESRYRQLVQSDSQAWFAVGYLVARRQVALDDAARELARLRKVRIAWRSGRPRS